MFPGSLSPSKKLRLDWNSPSVHSPKAHIVLAFNTGNAVSLFQHFCMQKNWPFCSFILIVHLILQRYCILLLYLVYS